MEKIKDFYKNITQTGWIIISIVFTLILLVFLVNSASNKKLDFWPFNNNSTDLQSESLENKESLSEDERYSDTSKDSVLSVEDVLKGDYKNDYESATVFVQNSTEVSVAVYFDDEESVTDKKDQKVCGKLTFVTIRLPKTDTIINDTIRAVFDNKIQTDFKPGNVIPAEHPNLLFDRVNLENGIAKVYLKGEFSGNNSDNCGLSMALTQISETLKKFDGVKDVEIYQNLQKIN